MVPVAPGCGALKLGHPVPDSNFVSLVKRSCPHPAHENVPARFSVFSAQLPARSVACFLRSGIARE